MTPTDNVDRVIEWLVGHLKTRSSILANILANILSIFSLGNNVWLLLWFFNNSLDTFLNELRLLFDLNKLLVVRGATLGSLSVVGRVVFFWLTLALHHNA